MNEEETYMGEWPVKPYYKRDLAMGYAPDITPVAALNRLSAWIHHHKPLYQVCSIRDMRTDSVFSIRYKWG